MDPRFADLSCPKCSGTMRAQERQGVVIDVCAQCRGVFLDRGELDRLLDLEAVAMPYAGDRLDPVGAGPAYGRGDWDDDDDDDRRRGFGGGYDPRYDDRYRGGDRPRRRGFLGDLLDGFD